MKKPVKIAGVKQNCYVLDTYTDTRGLKKFKTQTTYDSLEKKQLPNGYIEQVETKDYPINSASVTSYADGADYRTDPLQAIANAPNRVNLGDISELQNFLNGADPQAAIRVYEGVVEKLKAYAETQKVKEQTEVIDNGEVKQ